MNALRHSGDKPVFTQNRTSSNEGQFYTSSRFTNPLPQLRMKKFAQHLLVLAVMLFSTVSLKAQDIALYFDPAFVDTQPNCNGEAYNLQQFLQNQGFLVTTFSGTDQASWETAL